MAFRAIRARLEALRAAESDSAPTSAMPLRSRTALGDIGNRFAGTKKRGATKATATLCRRAPVRRRRAAKEQKAPPPSLEPQELEPQCATSVQTPGCDLSEDTLCRALSEMCLDVEGKHGDDPDFSSSYKNLGDLKEIKVKYA